MASSSAHGRSQGDGFAFLGKKLKFDSGIKLSHARNFQK